MERNPFEDDENPFADPSVTNATKSSQQTVNKADGAGFEDYNPFAEDNVSKPAEFSNVPIPPPQPSEPAVIDTRSEQPNSYTAIATEQENLAKRQEELERRAAELHEKEQELKNMKYRERKNNFPPFPKFCPLQPCFYHDISVDIPPDFQRTSRFLFYAWEFYCFTMFYNVVCALAYTIMDHDGTVTFIVALIFFLLFVPCSFCLWYRPSYNAFKSDSSFSFMIFFFVLFFQILFNGLACLGIDQVGTCGFINGASMFDGDDGGHKVVGLMMFACAGLFVINAILDILLLRKVHMIYRSTGASIKKAQAEFAQGAMSNKTVQNAAVAGATAAAQNAY